MDDAHRAPPGQLEAVAGVAGCGCGVTQEKEVRFMGYLFVHTAVFLYSPGGRGKPRSRENRQVTERTKKNLALAPGFRGR